MTVVRLLVVVVLSLPLLACSPGDPSGPRGSLEKEEIVKLTAAPRLLVSEYFVQRRRWPQDAKDVGFTQGQNALGEITIGPDGRIVFAFGAASAFRGGRMILVPASPDKDTVVWSCRIEGISGVGFQGCDQASAR